jgi:CoA:oxalate CoA-transferase
MNPNSAPGVLQGIRVIDYTQVIAGPYAGQQLALLGADVLKVESASGDALRWRGGSDVDAASQGVSTAFCAHAHGRRWLALDSDSTRARDQLQVALAQADVLICNLRPSARSRMGVEPEQLLRTFPKLIVATLSGYGADSASADWPAYDNTIQAASGLMRLTGTGESAAGTRIGAPILDYASGMALVSGVLAAVIERQRSGRGQHVRVSMLDVAHQLMSAQRHDWQRTGREPQARGNGAGSGEPLSRVFACASGHLALGVNEPHQFVKLSQALGEAWHTDARFATRAARRDHKDALIAWVQAKLMTQTALHWEALLNTAGVAAAAVRSMAESTTHAGAHAAPELFSLDRGTLPIEALSPPQTPDALMTQHHQETPV